MPETALAAPTVKEVLAAASERLAAAGCETPRLDAELLLARALGHDSRSRLVIDGDLVPSSETRGGFERLLERRERREPVAYVLGSRAFRGVTLSVDRRVLIPRPETELLVELALTLPQGSSVADVGTGSGAVALALSSERRDLLLTGIDSSAAALRVAVWNRERLGLHAVELVQADLLDADRYDAVLANLPYVASGERVGPEIALYEPRHALFSGADGLDALRRLAARLADAARCRLRGARGRCRAGARGGGASAGGRFQPGRFSPRPRRPRTRGSRAPVSGGGSPGSGGSLVVDFARCLAAGGVAVFPADTVYGLACDPSNRLAVERLYLLKRRPREKASAVMSFSLTAALEALPELPPAVREALERLLPGAVTALVPNEGARFPLACGDDPSTLGLRVPAIERFAGLRAPLLQSSANLAGGSDPRRLEDVPELLRAGADLVIDGGELPGTPSTVIDLRSLPDDGSWSIVREGAVSAAEVSAALDGVGDAQVRYRTNVPGGQFHFDPTTYLETIKEDIPVYERLQGELAAATGSGARRILELGAGTGETTQRLLARHPAATVIGIDASAQMLDRARQVLPGDRVELCVARLEDPLPEGPFDLVASALCVHHLTASEKRDLFRRIAAALAPGGRFVLADVVVPEDPADAVTSLTPDFDRPSSVAEQLEWLAAAGLEPRVVWEHRDLAVVVAV